MKLRAALLAGLLVALSSGAGESNVRLTRGELHSHKAAACSQQLVTVTLNVGTASWTVPTGVTTLARVAAIGGGGGTSNGANNSGGAGAAYSEVDDLAVTPGNHLTLAIGPGGVGGASGSSGNNGTAGSPTSVSYNGTQILLAPAGTQGGGGHPGTGGQASAGVGTIKFSGGNGGAGNATGVGGGGGGGAGGPNGNGVAGTSAPTTNAGGGGGAGDNGSGGTGGSPGPGNGTRGGTGGNGSEFSGGGSGGGGGGGSFSTIADAGGNGGSYGAGGGAAAYPNTTTFPAGGNGAPGVVFVAYSTCGSLPPPPPPVASFFVSPTGSDSNAGTLAAPFGTLGQCQSAMRNSSTIKTCTLRAGTYAQSATLTLGSSDSGETWQFYSADGVDTAVLDGGSTVELLELDGANNVTINGLKFQHCGNGCIFGGPGVSNTPSGVQASGIVIENNDISNNTGSIGQNTGGVLLENFVNTTITHNYIHSTPGHGICLFAFNAGESLNGDVVSSNVMNLNVQSIGDDGAIYIEMPTPGTSGGSVTIANNYVINYGAAGLNNEAVGIYLDGDTSNTTVTGNIIGAPVAVAVQNWFAGILVNGGSYNVIKGNLIDIWNGTLRAASWDNNAGTPAGTTNIGSVFEDNIVIENFTGAPTNNTNGVTGTVFFQTGPASDYTIQNDAYWNYAAGGTAYSNGNVVSDASPQVYTGTQLGLACGGGVYLQSGTATVNGAPVNFPPLPTSWGPPGLTLPASTNHSC